MQRKVLFDNLGAQGHRRDGYIDPRGVVRVTHRQAKGALERLHGAEVDLGIRRRVPG